MAKRARRKGILYTTLKRAPVAVDSSVRDFNVHSLIQVSNLNKIGNMIVFADSGIERTGSTKFCILAIPTKVDYCIYSFGVKLIKFIYAIGKYFPCHFKTMVITLLAK